MNEEHHQCHSYSRVQTMAWIGLPHFNVQGALKAAGFGFGALAGLAPRQINLAIMGASRRIPYKLTLDCKFIAAVQSLFQATPSYNIASRLPGCLALTHDLAWCKCICLPAAPRCAYLQQSWNTATCNNPGTQPSTFS